MSIGILCEMSGSVTAVLVVATHALSSHSLSLRDFLGGHYILIWYPFPLPTFRCIGPHCSEIESPVLTPLDADTFIFALGLGGSQTLQADKEQTSSETAVKIYLLGNFWATFLAC